MLKNGLFMMAVGFIALILGTVGSSAVHKSSFALSILFISIGFILYDQAEQKKK